MTRLAPAFLLAAMAFMPAACGPKVEYRVRPGFATRQDLPDEVVLDDGTIIRYLELNEYLAMQGKNSEGKNWGADAARSTTPTEAVGAGQPESIPWEEYDDGTVKMTAERLEHVVALTMRAFREERYAELWDQLVSPGVRQRAAAEATGPTAGPNKARERFIEWCAKWRTEVMTLLNRMSFAFSSNQVIFDRLGPGLVRLRLAPQISGEFKYRSIEVYTEQTPQGERAYLGGIR
jgi:hypothetical protein